MTAGRRIGGGEPARPSAEPSLH